jgi:hypothetical protein
MNYLEELIHCYFPTFAAFASLRFRSGHALREKFRDSVALCRASMNVMSDG